MMEKTLSIPLLEKKIGHKKIQALLLSFLPTLSGALPILWQLLFFYFPLILLGLSSILIFNENGGLALTLSHYSTVAQGVYFKIATKSILLALSTTFLSLVLALPFAYLMAFRFQKIRSILLFLLLIPFWTNFLLHVCAWTFVLEYDGVLNNLLIFLKIIKEPLHLLNSHLSTMVMMVYYYLPFMVLPIYAAFERFDVRLLEASMNLGASFSKTLAKVLIPLTMPAIRNGIFLVMIPAFGEFVIPELMGGDKTLFVGSAIAHLIADPKTIQVATSFTMMAIGMLMITSFGIHLLLEMLRKKLVGVGGRR